jgi:hypothetical protein
VIPALNIDAETLAEGLDVLESAMNH